MSRATLYRLGRLPLALALLALNLATFSTAQAAPITIPDGDVAALLAALETADTVVLAAHGTYTLSSPDEALAIDHDVVIQGNGATIQESVADPGNTFDILSVPASTALRLDHLTILGGLNGIVSNGMLMVTESTIAGNVFDGIGNDGGTLVVRGSTISDNEEGIGVRSNFVLRGRTTVVNSTIANNRGYGVGILNTYCDLSCHFPFPFDGPAPASSGECQRLVTAPHVTFTNVTIANNALIGVLFDDCTAAHMQNTIIAGNAAGVVDCKFWGRTILVGGNNLVSSPTCGSVADVGDPLLATAGLQDNGGPTLTIALQAGSPAIDHGTDFVCRWVAGGVDQRGVTRPQGPHCDIGAFELAAGG